MYSLKELKKFAKNGNLKGYQHQTKKELADRLRMKLDPSREVLKNMARERGWKGYQNLKKEDFKKILNIPIPAPRTKKDFSKKPIPAPRTRKDFSKKPIPAPRNILDIKNPEINIPILKPEKVKVNASEAPSIIQNTVETFSGWLKWLKESGKEYVIKPVSEKLKNLKEKINAIFQEKKFEAREGQSALKNFVREYIIDGRAGHGPQRFFEAVRDLLIKILQENKNTKTKMIFICKMQRTDLKTGEIIKIDADFIQKLKKILQKPMKINY